MTNKHQSRPSWSAKGTLFIGGSALLALVGGLGLWSVRTELSGAVIASGLIVVESNRQIIQHSEGGVIGEILARDGDRITKGDAVLRLDDTMLRSELTVVQSQLIELRARRARLRAERNEEAAISFPGELLKAAQSNTVAREQIEGQNRLFIARRDTQQREIAQVSERITQTRNQIAGTQAQLAALAAQEQLIIDELTDQEMLLKRGLVQASRVTSLKRESARLAGDIGKLTADIAQFHSQIAAFELEKLKLDASRREQTIVTLRDLEFREIELEVQRLTLSERLARMDVRAPSDGIVYGSTVFAVQAVVQAAEPLMFVIPQDQPLLVSARIEAIHIDQVYIGQHATLRFTAFNQRITPEISGRVTNISADIIQDEVTGVAYYRVDVEPLEMELPGLSKHELLPGMPVEAYLKTDDRTPLSYLVKPMSDYFSRAMRES